MLELRPSCEHCNKSLPNDSSEAMICTFECTFCTDCVKDIFENVCPNCGGGFTSRPTRPKGLLDKHPASKKLVYKPANLEEFIELKNRNKNIDPRLR